MDIAQLIRENQELKEQNALLRQELAQLKKMIFGQKRERFTAEVNANQSFLNKLYKNIQDNAGTVLVAVTNRNYVKE